MFDIQNWGGFFLDPWEPVVRYSQGPWRDLSHGTCPGRVRFGKLLTYLLSVMSGDNGNGVY